MLNFDNVSYPSTKLRRDRMRELGICINGSLVIKGKPSPKAKVIHGPPVKAGKCQRCLDVHQKSRTKSDRSTLDPSLGLL